MDIIAVIDIMDITNLMDTMMVHNDMLIEENTSDLWSIEVVGKKWLVSLNMSLCPIIVFACLGSP